MKINITLFLLIISSLIFSQDKFPQWAKGIVWYQIFPERFANGDPTNDPKAEKVFINGITIPEDWAVTEWTSNWFGQSEWEKKLSGNVRDHLYERRYGGDIQGIIDRLDYIKELGVGAIYLNPVFEAVSLHKYDGSSYHHIDINFGPDPIGDEKLMKSEIPGDAKFWKWTEADKLFLKLVDEVHKRGMKIIIDGVFNHTGVQFWAFQDIVKYQGASKYKDWYKINSFDDPTTSENEFDYKGWWNIKSLPEFNRTENDLADEPKNYIFQSTQRWMDPDGDGDPSDGIDGWRLDVAREVPIGFWKQWRDVVKAINPQSIIVGELWEFSPDFISADGPFDALMNYNFAFAVNDFFIADKNKITVDEFINKLSQIDKIYPPDNLFILQNLLTSHDTERLSSLISNPDREYDRDANEGNTNYNAGKPTEASFEKQKLIAAFQLLYRGAPMIYYGDEIGMWGADDPHCRKPMVWDDLKYDNEVINKYAGFKTGFGSFTVEQNKDLLMFYKNIIGVRNSYEELSRGEVKFIYSDSSKRAFAFSRASKDKKIVCIFNLGDDELSITFDFNMTEIYSGKQEELKSNISKLFKEGMPIIISPNSFAIYKAEKLNK